MQGEGLRFESPWEWTHGVDTVHHVRTTCHLITLSHPSLSLPVACVSLYSLSCIPRPLHVLPLCSYCRPTAKTPRIHKPDSQASSLKFYLIMQGIVIKPWILNAALQLMRFTALVKRLILDVHLLSSNLHTWFSGQA